MRIKSLTLKNFRGFEDATLDLDRPLTVLFGVNGSGKSSVIDACAVSLSVLLERGQALLDSSDLRIGSETAEVRAQLLDDGTPMVVSTRHTNGGTITPTRVPSKGLVLFALYRSTRQVQPYAFAASQPASRPLTPPMDDWAGHTHFRLLFLWFKEREDVENERKVAEQNFSLEDPQLAAVRRAIAGMLPAFSGMRIQRDPLHMVIRKKDETLAIDQLSDGEKLLLALAADLARRLAMVAPSANDPLQGEAVVLIDEIELHLHPSWQRTALTRLRTTFPNCQFVVTTHSPQVLSEVPNDAVFLVHDFHFYRPAAPTAGRDSNAILAEAMDTPERPAAQLAAIREVSKLLDEGRHAEARTKLDALAGEISEIDREVVTLRNMLHFLEGVDAARQEGA
jgi:predicted ATP-binding protein involved in virulence